ncbi:hypothetical protein DEU56DRAFT_815030 [Suillus clintonianus]|uniref:uncharacterized protein n=1 Tax=Suillus clintonianus TaxID=1904413 RepID=UPI001B885EBF|nr:uncharacterized protein DEU56DRAFT_815030 [Suillus clintonianus]KAG2130908.1 hypothetical protein DEU56DRAFT_815030 [Suillus clintonianus]
MLSLPSMVLPVTTMASSSQSLPPAELPTSMMQAVVVEGRDRGGGTVIVADGVGANVSAITGCAKDAGGRMGGRGGTREEEGTSENHR